MSDIHKQITYIYIYIYIHPSAELIITVAIKTYRYTCPYL